MRGMGGSERLPVVGIVAGSLLALLAIFLSLASINLLKTARYDDCRSQASVITAGLHFAVKDRLRRVAAGDLPREVSAAWQLGDEGVLSSEPSSAPPPPPGLLEAARNLGDTQRAITDGTLAATWLPVSRLRTPRAGCRGLLVQWDIDAVRSNLIKPLLDSSGKDYRVVLYRGSEPPKDLEFRPRGYSRPEPPFSFWRVGVGLVDSGATKRALRVQAWLLAGLSLWLFLLLAGSVGLYAKRERNRERARRAREQFLTRATHELQTPLALMRAAAETIKRGAASRPQDIARCADIVVREEERLTRTVRRLLRYLRLESAAEAMGERASVREEVERACAEHEGALQAQGIALELEAADDFPSELLGPRHLVGDTLAELLANARKHARGGSVVRVRLELAAPGRARLTVEDDGPGLAEGLDPEQVFAPWSGGDEDAARGSGLGLALLREGLDRVGGAIRCEPAAGKGARFVVELPGEEASA
jgi:signal transduction histidine kinase